MSDAKDGTPNGSAGAGQAAESGAPSSVSRVRQPPAGLRLPVPGTFRSVGNAWMVTFTDLIALMLTFFVLLFSMSSLEQQKWRELVGALSEELNTMTPSDAPRPTVVLQVKRERDPVPGADLDYLEQVLLEQLAAEPALDSVALRRGRRGVVLSLPAARVFDGGGAAVTDAVGRMAYPLARLLQNLGNNVEITVVSGEAQRETDPDSRWRLALARAKSVSDLLVGAGYDGPLVVRAAVAEHPDRAGDLPRQRLEITVTQQARGAE